MTTWQIGVAQATLQWVGDAIRLTHYSHKSYVIRSRLLRFICAVPVVPDAPYQGYRNHNQHQSKPYLPMILTIGAA